jgi:excisionase family DNA binding protein
MSSGAVLEAERLITVAELATMLSVPVATIYKWRTTGRGPRAARVGKYLRFRLEDVESWLDAQSEQPDA